MDVLTVEDFVLRGEEMLVIGVWMTREDLYHVSVF